MPNIYDQSFWDKENEELWGDMAEPIMDMYMNGLMGGVNVMPDNIKVLADWDRVNRSALDFAKEYHYSLIKGITDTTKEQTQKAISDWVQSGTPLSTLEKTLQSTFGEARAARIAATETTRVFAHANRDAFESTGLIEEVVWQTAQDDLTCVVCGELDGTHIGVGDIDAFPPAHPSCRCWITPVVSEDALSRRLDEVLK
jgi:SPP1 gp7 family putative phage head morphogenesis protein